MSQKAGNRLASASIESNNIAVETNNKNAVQQFVPLPYKGSFHGNKSQMHFLAVRI
jgi:hypothetical protein